MFTGAVDGRRGMRRAAARLVGALLLLLAMQAPAWGALALDVSVSSGRSSASSTLSSTSFATSGSGELLLAFVATDAAAAGANVVGVTGGGLAWALVRRSNAQPGDAEIWRAYAPTALAGVSVTATLSQSVAASITVIGITGADASGVGGAGAIGATGGTSAASGAPQASVVTTRANSWVFGVGNDYDRAIARVPASDQTLVSQYLASTGDTYWVQRRNTPTANAGTSVAIADASPTTDRYNLAVVEVLPAAPAGSTFAVSGAIAPASLGAGAVLTLSQGATALSSSSSDASGNYRFSSVANGTFVVTPAKSGVSFTPASQAVTVGGAAVTLPTFAASASVTATYTVSGSISPAFVGAGTRLVLSQAGQQVAATTAGAIGTYSFTGVGNGSYTVTPGRSGVAYSPASAAVTVNGGAVTVPAFVATVTGAIHRPDLSVVIPSGRMAIVGTGSGRMFQYTHDTFNGGSGPLVIQPTYNPASGAYLGTQYVYALSGSTWTLAQQWPIAGAFVFDAAHGHFHFPFVSFGLYTVGSDGGPGAPVALSSKDGYCIDDSFIYAPTLPNAGALGNLGACTDPTSLRGLDIGAVDEYDETDPGQSISLAGVADGTYWLRAIADPENFLFESDKSNNETDVLIQIVGNTVTELQRVTPVLPPPPVVALTSPADQARLSGSVTLLASPPGGAAAVQFLLNGQPLGAPVPAPYALNWDTTTVPDGVSWLAVQATDAVSGRTGTSAVARVTVANGGTRPPVVTVIDPDPGSVVSAISALGATVAATSPVVKLQFLVDGLPVGSPLTAPPYLDYWDSRTASDGPHVVAATATDTFGLVGTSAPVAVTVDNSHPPGAIGVDAVASRDGAGVLATPAFSTTSSSDLLVAFVAYDGPPKTAQTASVSGAGLAWSLAMRSNTQGGTSEVWFAKPGVVLTGASVSAQPGYSGFHGSLTVMAFSNAAGIGIVGRAAGMSGAPDIYLPGISAGNWVYAVGNDWDAAIGRAPSPGQILVHQRLDTAANDTFWVQATRAPSAANALVDIHDTAPATDQWNYAAVEIVAARP